MTETELTSIQYILDQFDECRSVEAQMNELLLGWCKRLLREVARLKSNPISEPLLELLGEDKPSLALQSAIPVIKEKLAQKKTSTNWTVDYERNQGDIQVRKQVETKTPDLSSHSVVLLVPVGTNEEDMGNIVTGLKEAYGEFTIYRVIESKDMTQEGKAAVIKTSDYFNQAHMVNEGLRKEASDDYYDGPPMSEDMRLSFDRETY